MPRLPVLRLNRSALPPLVAAIAAAAAFIVGIRDGTFVAGGSDSSCYVSAGRLFAHGAIGIDEPLARSAPWRDAAWTFAPAGHVPSPARPGLLVPMCPPGLPLAMALVERVHLSPFVVVPMLGAAAIWLTFLVGRRIDSPLTGAVAAVLVACSPIFLYQVVQPMTDVPAATWWLLVVAVLPRHIVWAGLATSIAVLTRPNLAPLVAVVATYVLVVRRDRVRAVLSYAAAVAPGAIALAAIQHEMYGSALATGYGPTSNLFSSSNVLPNLARYPAWLVTSHTPVLVLALAAPFLVRRAADAWLCLALACVTLLCYLPYVVFEDWWYIRFLLPAVPLLVLLTVAAARRAMVTARLRAATSIVLACAVAVAAVWVRTAAGRHAFEFGESEYHYYQAGALAARHLPGNAVVLTVRDSGSVSYYARVPTLLWDVLRPDELDRALAFLRERGYRPYVLLEADEEDGFRSRFRGRSTVGELDWPPSAEADRAIRLYEPADRATFLADGRVRTAFDWGRSRRSPRTWWIGASVTPRLASSTGR